MTRPTAGDAAVAVGAAGLVVAVSLRAETLQSAPHRLDAWAVALIVAAAGALAWRRIAPLPMLAAAVLATSGYLAAGYPYGPIQFCAGWAMFEVARRRPLPVSALAAGAAAVVSAAAVAPRLTGELDVLGAGLALWVGCWLAVPFSLGAVVNVRAAAARQARRDLAAQAALRERIRMSREVHDVAGHGFAVIAMQAGVALVVLDKQPGQARASLEAIRAAAIAALTELRGVLEPEPAADPAVPGPAELPEPAAAPAVPGPAEMPEPAADPAALGLADVPGLVERARAAGLPVVLRDAAAGTVPAGTGAVAYRVVRESLTNVIRHAGPTKAAVTLERDGGTLVVTVADRGPGAGAGTAGRGLAGLRARVEAAGGTFDAGAGVDGGFTVRARLPVHPEAR